ncbi:poliovirus receptor-related protein 3-like [Platysternon megacephalum]|uniref:Poliovirus receptor-related protein 3-like n=1 Tax=Platysternon megacephalum TaxID=55544 RepID=A0A4D9DRK5_9SAUR|nr:poliovirus receptor-related protein 3-like [Platysternon megacephalum]
MSFRIFGGFLSVLFNMSFKVPICTHLGPDPNLLEKMGRPSVDLDQAVRPHPELSIQAKFPFMKEIRASFQVAIGRFERLTEGGLFRKLRLPKVHFLACLQSF